MINKIVITGGPCAGKTTCLEHIGAYYSSLGFEVIIIPETATNLINSGVTNESCGSAINFQRKVMKNQLFNENNIRAKTDKTIVFLDRGLMDGSAYITDEEFSTILAENGISLIDARDRYDAVFHLMTGARADDYTTENNPARTESKEQAIELDNKIISAWVGAPHFRVIENERNFEDKLNNLISEISFFLGIPRPYEIERKFLIEYPKLNDLSSNPFCKRVEIEQYYLYFNDEGRVRARKRGANGSFIYFKTIKKDISKTKRIEIESIIDEAEYNRLINSADKIIGRIIKERYCLYENGKYFEIDVFPFWFDKALLEIELRDENEAFELPSCVTPIREVTTEREYKNSYLAQIYRI